MILKKNQPWDVFHQIPKNGEAHCCQRGGVDIGIWIVALNGRLTRTVSLFAAKLSIVPKFVGLQIPVQIFNLGVRLQICLCLVDVKWLEVGCQWTPWRQHNLGDPLARHDWFGKRYYCATSRRWPGGSTSESGKDFITRSRITMMEYRALTNWVNLQRLERWRATVRKRRVAQFCCVECEVSSPSCKCTT